MYSPEEKGKPEPLIATGSQSLVSIVESRVTWLRNARFCLPDARNVIGVEEATSQDALRHLRSEQPPKNPLHLGIRDPETTKLTQELAVRLEQGETFVSGTQWQTEK